MSEKLNFGQVNLLNASGYTGTDWYYMNVLTTGDLNNDGNDDLVVGMFLTERGTGQPLVRGEIKSVVLFYNAVTQKYEPNSAVQNQLSVNFHPRQAAIGDFNGDGKNDLYIADHGQDFTSIGFQNTLLVGSDFGLKNGTNLLPQIIDYSHGLIVDDFNRDGIKDLLVINTPFLTLNGTNTNLSYVLSKTADGKFVRSTLPIADKNDFNFTDVPEIRNDASYYELPAYHVGTSSDFNKDGYPDLVFAGDFFINILESDGRGGYRDNVRITVPADYVAKYGGKNPDGWWTSTPYSYLIPYDINGDGVNEIIASYCNHDYATGLWTGRQFQVAQRDSQGVWKDITYSVFGEQNFDQTVSGVSAYKISLSDVNADGKKDLVISNFTPVNTTNNNVWLFQDGKFVQSANWSQYQGYQQFVVATINGKEHLVGFRYNNSNTTVEIAAWKNPTPTVDEIITVKDPNSLAAEAYRLYNAAFDRTPDPVGLGYWIYQMEQGMDFIEVSARFIDSDEFRTLYGTNPSNDLFLTKLYNNVLDRDPDSGGYEWWLNELNTNPEKTPAKVLADFSESTENKQATELEITTVGITVDPWGGG